MPAQAAILAPRFPRKPQPPSFREAMRQIPGGVGLVTGTVGDERFALTATSVAPLSIDPPTLIVCVDIRSARRYLDFGRLRRFGVSILAAQHRALAERCLDCTAIDDTAPGDRSRWLPRAEGVPLLADAILAADCIVEEIIERHAQAIVIGRIDAIRAHGASSALVYWQGEYDQLGWTEDQIASATGLKPV